MKNRFLLFLLASCANICAQSIKNLPAEKPKLIIAIVIDQMRYDYLFKFWEKYENNGFKRLINEGSFCKNAYFNYLYNQSNVGIATIATGTNPSIHGIVADEWYVQLLDKNVHCTLDNEVTTTGGNRDSEKHSAKNLLASTIGDELKLASYKKSKVISVSFTPSAAVLSAGHIADGAWWFDNETGNFVTSSIYQTILPQWVDDFNNKKLADTYLDRRWETILPDSTYIESLPDKNNYEIGFKNGQITFPYNLAELSTNLLGKRNYSILKYTPYSNSLTKDFAVSTIVNEKLGKDDYTDYLCVNFAATEYIAQQFGISSVEIEDAYIRLDKEIRHFLDFIDSAVGKGNVLLYLTSNHGAVYNTKLMTDMGVPAGTFNQFQALSLLKSYLNIVYGTGDWVKYYNNQQLFLNRNLIQDSKLQLAQVQNDVAQFLLQFTGVTNVATSTMLQNNSFGSGIFQKMQNSYHQKRSGDIIINLEPGWTEKTELASSNNSGYAYDTHVPLVFYGWKITRQTISDPIDITDIAPSIALFLDISYPNASQGKPIIQLLK